MLMSKVFVVTNSVLVACHRVMGEELPNAVCRGLLDKADAGEVLAPMAEKVGPHMAMAERDAQNQRPLFHGLLQHGAYWLNWHTARGSCDNSVTLRLQSEFAWHP